MPTATIHNALDNNLTAYYIGNRLILPFKCQLIKVIVESHIFTDMSGSDELKIEQGPRNTSIYIKNTGMLRSFFDTYKTIKMVCSEYDTDLTDAEKHVKLVCRIGEKHQATIETPGEDILFIE